MAKKYDIVATVGEYTDSQGQPKKRYKNVGAIISNDKGFYMLMDKTFNPAGLADPSKDSIILSLFEPKQQGSQQAPQQNYQQQPQQQPAPQQAPVGNFDDFDDDIPF